MSQTRGHVTIRKNVGADIGTQPRLNLVEGANITLTIADDPVNHEVDISIAAAGGGEGADLSQWFPASDPDSFKGRHPTMRMLDGVETLIRQSFHIPPNVASIDTAVVVIIPNGTGNLVWTGNTDYGQFCVNEQYDTHSGATGGTTGVTNGEIECIDITGALANALAEDVVGIEFTRDGADGADTIDATVHFLGIWIKGT